MGYGYKQPATKADALYIAKNLRDEDRLECDALVALPPEIVVPACATSPHCWTFHSGDGEPVGIFGCDPIEGAPDIGKVWMCSTPKILQHKIEFLRGCAPTIADMHEIFPILTNHVDARNALHINWLRWLGFSFLRRVEQWGARGVPFYEFARMKT